jgi:hypothetical protein
MYQKARDILFIGGIGTLEVCEQRMNCLGILLTKGSKNTFLTRSMNAELGMEKKVRRVGEAVQVESF